MRERDLRTERWPRLCDGEGLEPTAIFLHADAIVATARAGARAPGPAPRRIPPSVMERDLVARMVRELATPVPRRAVTPNPFLVPPGPDDPPPPWTRTFDESRPTLAAEPEPRRGTFLPLLLFLAFGAATFADVAAWISASLSRGSLP